MMGRNDKPQNPLFYSFNLDDLVPQDHLLRKIDHFLDLSDLRQHLAPYYSHTGRPSIDPGLMIRMLIIGYCLGIRSERRLCEEVRLNLAYRWFCRLSIEDPVPDHSTFSKNRHGRFRQAETLRFVFEQVEERLALKTRKLIGDTAYGTAEILGWMVEEKGIEPHVPVWEKAERKDGTFSRSDFSYDAVNDEYTCPVGKRLKQYWTSGWQSRSRKDQDSTLRYHSLKKDCEGCTLKEQCCPNTQRRKVTRSVHEAARDVARAVSQTPAYRQTRRQRKQVEMLFAHMKRILKVDRLRLRGIKGAQDEFLLTATAQNLRRMAKYLGTGPPKTPEMA